MSNWIGDGKMLFCMVAVLFSLQDIFQYQEAFNPKTFLYKEEELLYLRCKKADLKIVYNPKLIIKHLEDAATNSVNRQKKRINCCFG